MSIEVTELRVDGDPLVIHGVNLLGSDLRNGP